MTTRNDSISRLCGIALGGLLVGLPATAALAADPEPITAGEAQAKADDYREQADHARAMGGVGYSTGKVKAAEAEAAKYAALAEQLSPTAAATTAQPSAEVEHYADLAAHYRLQGGVAYKAGLVRWAEMDQQRAEAKQQAEAAKQPTYEPAPVPATPSTDAPNSGP